jgi:hypothetical protein
MAGSLEKDVVANLADRAGQKRVEVKSSFRTLRVLFGLRVHDWSRWLKRGLCCHNCAGLRVRGKTVKKSHLSSWRYWVCENSFEQFLSDLLGPSVGKPTRRKTFFCVF